MTELFGDLSPGLILIFGAVLVPLLFGWLRMIYVLALPVIAALHLFGLDHGTGGVITLFDMELTTLRVDGLSLAFGYIFLIAAFLGVLYQFSDAGWAQQVAGLVYAGSAIGAVFAGDLITLFVYWEGTAIASVFLIWARQTEAALAAAMRYLIIQIGSGVLLLAGAMHHYGETGSIAFESFDIGTLGGLLILISFGIKAAFPLLHSWLPDAYPEATVSGAVILSAFTTKLAIYSLARGYAGTEILVPIGAIMAIFPVLYGLIEDDLRRLLAYALNSQLGFMVVGIGVGTELAVNGAVAHASVSVLYKALLFMAVGAVLFRTGTARSSELGGLYRTMPWTTAFCLVGAASIAAFPLFAGFPGKSLILSAAGKEGWFWPWLALVAVGAGTFLYVGIKVPFYAFFAGDSGMRPREAPWNMLAAMGIASALCIGLGVFPELLYANLPYATDYDPYTLAHIVTQLQLLALSALVFTVVVRSGLFQFSLPSTNLDTDWFYRRVGKWVAWQGARGSMTASQVIGESTIRGAQKLIRGLYRTHGPQGLMAETRATSSMALWMTVMLLAFLVLAFF